MIYLLPVRPHASAVRQSSPLGPLADFNRQLGREADAAILNETWLEKKFTQLESLRCDEPVYWLTLARVNELALLCAGNYADALEPAAAGDLLVNPRRIAVHVKKNPHPVIKQRHTALTEQFDGHAGSRAGVMAWLAKETALVVDKKPLLPYLQEALTDCGWIHSRYLETVERQMQQIACTIGFLAAWHAADSGRIHCRMRDAEVSQRAFWEANLCRFDTETFEEMGREVSRMCLAEHAWSRFLIPCAAVSACDSRYSSKMRVPQPDCPVSHPGVMAGL
jgi:hypothetical protein